MDVEQPASSEPRAPRLGLDRDALLHPDFLAAAGISQLKIVEITGSTNADLLRAVTIEPKEWADLAVLTAEHQTAARGRLDRHWESPERSAISVSIVLRPVNSQGLPVPTQSYSWLSLLGALALRETLLETAGLPAEIKWPNDVLVRGKKIAGILAQMGPMGDGSVPAVILGTGLNVTLSEDELPVPTATSLVLEGATTTDRTVLLRNYLSRFAALYRSFCNADGDPTAGLAGGSSLHKRVEAVMVTLGREVKAHLPGDHELVGHASRLDEYGSLLVVDHGGREHVVTAGDVVHLRATESGYA
ncbi:biotin--[acetyl-CoA-carboxylase] ligase [Arthrobacter bambusae]|uniref:biotin--[biotin carboxyl-carrier protein] ligase n=1 Tax=Arthrobacter bambusae TaxID=1338426 RepID=A0AAW8DBZ7_9MICC|nr:biotin--[acetyl-CoA-carboxylase] ligase [Arthrobacter bambusae]MDP9905303.1 BirA family biotin operon repressor/biotin-[acetyl-CoA-carboxylase] ligase [Arthrobacter bambusae]MDQ0129219.1 BirA family biotin operon repressor/biotin-[acetyl-CoA-carboxylase] ligase [Arthrobacter bambusae]MDQ0180435.1 BirA family biotin operon repressor/biotin-[acetyl-CoA-carboxylase] ligase [Arthrobacter bambusae]